MNCSGIKFLRTLRVRSKAAQVDQIQVGDITVDVVRKNIKNIHLRVYPPHGAVRVSAPSRTGLQIIRVFVSSKLGWIKKQQLKLRSQDREPPREYLDSESHWVWGKRYLLNVIEADCAPSVRLEHDQMTLSVRPGSTLHKKQTVVEDWHRNLIREALPELIAKWERILDVQVKNCNVRKMKTRWGSCTPRTGRIRINTHLVSKPAECLEYILVHEMAHLIEPSHNRRFKALMDQFIPKWKLYQAELNRRPVSHEDWSY
ncbi:MAG: SprT family zinc-dependent metalloprotease [Kiritimatiellales bacterium]|jgi:hypothetical protein